MTSFLRFYVPVYTITLLLSAFLLFGIQPLFAKMILPLLGGTPQVWNTAMVFFQAVLLAGYAYAHIVSRFLNLRLQAILHFALLGLFVFLLPISIPAGWDPPTDSTNPAFWQLTLMIVAVGGPFFVLSGSAPLFQHWFAHTEHKDSHNPYFLYAASNFGSITALLAYPFIVEPFLSLPQQSLAWSGGYVTLMVMVVLAASLIWNKRHLIDIADGPDAANDSQPSWKNRLYWLVLAFIPSSLMLGVTTYITTDLAAIPLLWIIPLALYVGTFIIVFSRTIHLPMKKIMLLHALLLTLALTAFMYNYLPGKIILIPLHLLLFFVSALICHHELAKTRPHAANLTEFYLIMSAGGVLGGILNALVAPVLFILPVEYALALAAVCFIRRGRSFTKDIKENWWAMATAVIFGLLTLAVTGSSTGLMACVLMVGLSLIYLHNTRYPFAVAVTALLVLYPGFNWLTVGNLLHIDRNFFGISRVYDTKDEKVRMYLHGTTNHGAQPLLAEYKTTPITYFHPDSSIGDIFRTLDDHPFPQEVAVLGLGIGSLVCYPHEGRHFDLFEIDPDVQRIAEDTNLFTYLSDCGSPYTVTLGDGRLQIAKMPDQKYDAIFLDAFSSDSIPVHLITREAFEIYLQKLKPGGIIISNISNNFLNLAPVLDAMARDVGLTSMFKIALGDEIKDTGIRYETSIFAVLARTPKDIKPFEKIIGWRGYPNDKNIRVWTDDYASIVSAFWSRGRPELCMEDDVPYHCSSKTKHQRK